MADELVLLFDNFRHSTWGDLGDITVYLDPYDSYLASVAIWYIQGGIGNAPPIPGPDAQWCLAADRLSQAANLTKQEEAFLTYFAGAEALRISLKKTRDERYHFLATALSLSNIELDVLIDASSDYFGLWRWNRDIRWLFNLESVVEARDNTERAVQHLLKEGFISLYQSTLVRQNERTPLEPLGPDKEIRTFLAESSTWLPPNYGSLEILGFATSKGNVAVNNGPQQKAFLKE